MESAENRDYRPHRDEMGRKDPHMVSNAEYVLENPLPDEFEWQGRGPEPPWFQKWIRKKAEYIVNIARIKGFLPSMIMYWKMEKIRDAFPDCDPEKGEYNEDP
jgi:hypothetical protein